MFLKSSVVNDTRLTLSDVGLYARICAFDDGEISEQKLDKMFPLNSRTSTRTSLKHLTDLGYLKRHQTRTIKGTMSYCVWELTE